jgi:hypothetical protein
MRRWGGDDLEALMASKTYYVALAFKRLDDNGDIVACDPKEARRGDQAIRMAAR